MINRMSFRGLKASISKSAEKQKYHQQGDNFVGANGAIENKDDLSDFERIEQNGKSSSLVTDCSKHRGKQSKEGVWKTLRRKFTPGRRKCRDSFSESRSHSDDSEQCHNNICNGKIANHSGASRSKTDSICTSSPPLRFGRPTQDTEQSESEDAETFLAAKRPLPDMSINRSPPVFNERSQTNTFSTFAVQTKESNDLDAEGSASLKTGDTCSNNRDYLCKTNSNNVAGPADCNSLLATAAKEPEPMSHENVRECFDGIPSLGKPEDIDIYETPKIRSLTRELFKLSKHGWYWGPITRTEAEEKLIDQPDGAFLVRDSSDDRHLLSLSFRSYGKTLHTRIEHCNGLFSFYAQPEPEGHTSIVDLIEHSMNYSQSGVFCYSRARTPGSPSFPVRLTKPVSRFTQVRSLQYLCRFIIRQYTRFDHIQKLPLPSRIKGYIEEGHY